MWIRKESVDNQEAMTKMTNIYKYVPICTNEKHQTLLSGIYHLSLVYIGEDLSLCITEVS